MSLGSFIAEIEEAVGSEDPIKRVDALRRVTALFVAQAPRLGEDHVAVFDEVIQRLAGAMERRARAELSERLAGVSNAPRRVVRDLAFDAEIAVAGPVLEGSTRIEEDDLVAIAKDRGQEHLLAVSRRKRLSDRVTDVLIGRGDRQVVRAVAGNAGARMSNRGFTHLLERARADAKLQDILRGRRDVPPSYMAQLIAIAREKTRETLTEEFGGAAAAALDVTLDEAAKAVGERGDRIVKGSLDAGEAVARKEGGLAEDDVVRWIKAGAIDEALAAISHLAAMPFESVMRAYQAPHHDPLLFIVRSVRFGWGTLKLLLTARRGRPPSRDELKSAFDAFQQLSVQTAERVVRFTAAHERALRTDAA